MDDPQIYAFMRRGDSVSSCKARQPFTMCRVQLVLPM